MKSVTFLGLTLLRDEFFNMKTSVIGLLGQKVGGETAGKIGEYLDATLGLADAASKYIGGELSEVLALEMANGLNLWMRAADELND